VQNFLSRVTPPSVIEIKPHRYGWTCAHCAGEERVFILKSQALSYARKQCISEATEIRVCDRHGSIEQRLSAEMAEIG
jgi:hypothetical protein